VTAVNALGDFDIAADRLAIIDGEGKKILISSPIYPYGVHVFAQLTRGDRILHIATTLGQDLTPFLDRSN